jgi:hypothetical protein
LVASYLSDSARRAEARYSNLHHPLTIRKFSVVKQKSQDLYRQLSSRRPKVAQQLPSDDTGSVMDFIAGLVVGFVIGSMLALFLFSWLTAMSEGENEP